MKVWFPVIRGGSGTDVFTRRLSDALRRRGIASEITWFSSHFQLAPFTLRRVPPPSGTTVVHANSWNAFAFKRANLPLLVTEHLNVLDPLYWPYKTLAQHLYHKNLIRRFVKASFRAASAITAVSQFTASSLHMTFGIQADHVIPNWVDTGLFLPDAAGPRSTHRPFRLLFMGNLSRRKGADLLAPIMQELGVGFELYFTSGLRPAKRMAVTPNMFPLGQITDEKTLIQGYHDADALLLPSRFEGLPLVLLEAMACGKPVIAARSSSLPEAIEDGVSGILCPLDDIEAFASACRKLAGDADTLQAYGRAARRRVEALYSEDAVIPQYIALYHQLQETQ